MRNHIFIVLVAILTNTTLFSQQALLKSMKDNESLIVTIEKIDCRMGLVDRYEFTVKRSGEKLMYKSNDEWTELSKEQIKSLKKFEKKAIRKGCNSTTYAAVSIKSKELEQEHRTCPGEVQELVAVLNYNSKAT